MEEIRLSLHISPDDFFAYYEGTAETVLATAVDGRTVSFPARVLRPFLTYQGIRGEFLIRFDKHHKFVGIKKLKKKA